MVNAKLIIEAINRATDILNDLGRQIRKVLKSNA